MWILNNEDYREYQAFKANGMTPNEVLALRQGVYPDDEGRAPHPDLDPAEERRSFEQDRRHELAEDFREMYQEIYGRDSCWLLETLGYPISDEERLLMSGEHPMFQPGKEETEDIDDEDDEDEGEDDDE